METDWKKMGMFRLCLMFYILQWNAWSLIANGQELKRFVDAFEAKPALICIQETWLRPALNFEIPICVFTEGSKYPGWGVCCVYKARNPIQESKC